MTANLVPLLHVCYLYKPDFWIFSLSFMASGENFNIKASLPQVGELSIPSERIICKFKTLAEEGLNKLT